MHPKNHHRRDAIDSKTYIEIYSEEDATSYLTKVLTTNLRNEFSGRESQIRANFQGELSSEQAKNFLNTPDIYYAAAVMVQGGFYIGRGDVTQILRKIMKEGQNFPVVKDKIRLLLAGTYF